MLLSLHVKNLALIDETEVYFGNGLNILTGETGAGKSIIIGSINLALGARADKDMIRTGAEYALVELVFQLREDQIQAVAAMDIPVEEDGTILIQRKIMPTRNFSKICGENATSKMVKDLAGLLIDIHGQHEHQSLFHIKKHMELLDDYAKEELTKVLALVRKQFEEYQKLKKELEGTSLDETEKEKEISLAVFEADEIMKANLRSGEDEILEAKYRKMINSKRIMESISVVYKLMGADTDEGVGELVGRAAREMKTVLEYDRNLMELDESLNAIDEMVNDFNRSAASYMSEMEFDAEEFDEAEARLDLLNHLKSKYGPTVDDVLQYGQALELKINKLKDYEEYRAKLEKITRDAEDKLASLCEKTGKIRKKFAKELSAELTDALLDLNFLEVKFEIQVRKKESYYSASGWNEVEFMISTNPGEPVKPLCDVASGGELSRIMLALKTVLAEKDAISTLIFDEIDAGISGKTAWKVSEKLAVLGNNHQVICITHLPQIAAMADNHFVINKLSNKGITKTSIEEIKQEKVIEELARLLGGEQITEAVLNNARELKQLATNTKQYESNF